MPRPVRKVFRHSDNPLTEELISSWVDAHHQRTGEWPKHNSGEIPGTSGITWRYVSYALAVGRGGLPGGSTLSRWLAEKRGFVKWQRQQPLLTEEQISAWVNAHHQRTGQWPQTKSGEIPGASGLTWRHVAYGLAAGRRGLPGGSTLARWLAEKLGIHKNLRQKRLLTEKQISFWVDAYHQRTGDWPRFHSGKIPKSGGLSWSTLNNALVKGRWGLAGGSSLATWLTKNRGVPKQQPQLRLLTEAQILAWADAYHERTGQWPRVRSGPIRGVRGEKWVNIDQALRGGARGFPGGSTLARFLAQRRGVLDRRNPPRLTKTQILAWADAYRQRTGKWPTILSGPIPEASGASWNILNDALRVGKRGLRGGSSLLKLLVANRRLIHPRYPPRLTIKQILRWADAHHQATGRWPNWLSGRVEHASQETWRSVNLALYKGTRGLPGGSTLFRLLRTARGVRQRRARKA
jgi:hypothetical protein